MNILEKNIEGLLFYFGDEMSYEDIARYTNASREEIEQALSVLQDGYRERGFELVLHNNKAKFVTSDSTSVLISEIEKKELEGELSKAAQEVLSIVLYSGPISKGYIDYIRGVNSTVSVRNLVARGLIERSESIRGNYSVTHAFLESIGVTEVASIEGYLEMRAKLEAILQQSKKEA